MHGSQVINRLSTEIRLIWPEINLGARDKVNVGLVIEVNMAW